MSSMFEALDLARATELYNLPPANYVDIAVTATAVVFDLNKLGAGPYTCLGGKRVVFQARTAAVTFLAGAHAAADTLPLVAAGGIVLAQDAYSQRYFIPPKSFPFTVIGAGGATLRVFFCDD